MGHKEGMYIPSWRIENESQILQLLVLRVLLPIQSHPLSFWRKKNIFQLSYEKKFTHRSTFESPKSLRG